MDELLKKLEMQAMVEGREHLRLLVMSLNGIAAIHILQEEVRAFKHTKTLVIGCLPTAVAASCGYLSRGDVMLGGARGKIRL